jgi:uncharacterized protein (DUF433 family)
MRLKNLQFERLQHLALQLNRTPSETGALLLEEALRMREFPSIEFRDTAAGREAFLKGTRIKVWHVANLARRYDCDVAAQAAAYLETPETQVRAALAYAQAFADEINDIIADNEWVGEHLLPLTPGYHETVVDIDAPAP